MEFRRYLTAESVRQDAMRMKPLSDLRKTLDNLSKILGELRGVLPPALAGFADGIEADIAAFEPRVSLLGQVKAGKTALANALIGTPDLLPSDVNPWTSVVTAVHLNAVPPGGHSAVFRFFNEADWERLVDGGGRFGQIASRADAGDEVEAISEQVASLRARTSERLGRNYRLLLGQAHRFREFSPALVRRYVCLGDEEESRTEGRFADLTRSADLFIRAPEFAVPVAVEDTPGVNDPFLVREQMTIETLGRASVCVLVLSAYQALSTVDLGLMRLLATLRPDQIVIFVNRVDELSDRAAEIPRIEASIRLVLRRHGLDSDGQIIFGSAIWAQRAIMGDLSDLSASDWDALTDPAQGAGEDDAATGDDRQRLQDHMRALSGVPELKEVIAHRIAAGPGQAALDGLVGRTRDLVEQAALHLDSLSAGNLALDEPEAAERLDIAVDIALRRLSAIERAAVGELEALQQTVVARWIDRKAAELSGSDGVVDTDAPRAALAKAYDEIAGEARRKLDLLIEETERSLRLVYASLLGDGASLFPMVRPQARAFGRPTPLARSSSFDVRGGWMEGFRLSRSRDLRREARFRDMADREFREILAEIEAGPLEDGFARTATAIHDFMLPHVRNILALAAGGGSGRGATLMEGQTREMRAALGALRIRLAAMDRCQADADRAA